jgi:hypothetical protein
MIYIALGTAVAAILFLSIGPLLILAKKSSAEPARVKRRRRR